MPRQGSTDRATASKRRTGPGPGSEARADDPSRPISDGLRSAIAASGVTISALDRISGATYNRIYNFYNRKGDIRLLTADKIAVALSVGLVPRAIAHGPEPQAEPLALPFTDGLRSAIAASGLSYYALGKKAGVDDQLISEFAHGETSIRLLTADKIAVALELKVAPEAKARRPEPKPLARPIRDALQSAFTASGLSAHALGKKAGVDDQTIIRFVNRDSAMRLLTADKIAVALSVGLVPRAIAHGPEPQAEPTPQSISDGLRSAFVASGLSVRALARAAGINYNTTYQFVHSQFDVGLLTADKFAVALSVVVRQAAAPPPEPDPPISNPLLPFMDGLRSAIAASRLSNSALARRSKTSLTTIRVIRNGYVNLTSDTFRKVADAVGLEVDPAILQARSDVSPLSPLDPLPAPRDSATNAEAPVPARRCPVELQGEGRPIRVYGKEVPPLKGIAYMLAEFAVERFHQGGECFATELADRTDTKRPIRLLMLKLKQPRFGPLARVLIWDARKGGMLRVDDPGPPG